MARLPRLTVADHLHHVLQRGNNRQPVFHDAADYEMMLDLLAEQSSRLAVALHAYLLMGNQFHLLATPSTDTGLPLMMQAVGRQYVQYFNRRHGRSGTLWEGRYRSSLVQPERYLLPSMVYLDLFPTRDGLAARARDYPWSSHAHWCGLRHDKLLTPHALYWALGNTPFAREAAYASLVDAGLGDAERAPLEELISGGWCLGDAGFTEALQRQIPRRASRRPPGRPRKA